MKSRPSGSKNAGPNTRASATRRKRRTRCCCWRISTGSTLAPGKASSRPRAPRPWSNPCRGRLCSPQRCFRSRGFPSPSATAVRARASGGRRRAATHFDVSLRASFHEVRGETYAALGEPGRALADCGVASRLANRSGVSELIAQIENNFALVAADLGELDLAIERHEISLAEARRTSMPWRVAYSALNYADTLTLRGELERARELVWEALESGVTTATFKPKPRPWDFRSRSCSTTASCSRPAPTTMPPSTLPFARNPAHRLGCGGLCRAAFGAGRPAEARALLTRALESISRPHRCWSLFRILPSRHPDRATVGAGNAHGLGGPAASAARVPAALRGADAAAKLPTALGWRDLPRQHSRVSAGISTRLALEAAGRTQEALDDMRQWATSATPSACAPRSAR